MDNRPIGVFDSGLGGLSVVRRLSVAMPHEDIVYFGDTGRVPYGSRSRETIIRYAKEDINFLLSKNVKIIIAACGTVSATLPQSEIARLRRTCVRVKCCLPYDPFGKDRRYRYRRGCEQRRLSKLYPQHPAERTYIHETVSAFRSSC